MEKLRTNWNLNIYENIQNLKFKILSRSGKIKNQLESKYLPKLKTQRVREKNLNAQCFKERKKRKAVTCEKGDWWWINSKIGFPNQTPKKKKKKKLWTQILGNRRWRCREKSMWWRWSVVAMAMAVTVVGGTKFWVLILGEGKGEF